MAASDWDWKYPTNLQDVAWDCAAASLTWCLNAYGVPITEGEVVAGLGPSRISPTYGLLDASGAGLVGYLAEIGIPAANNPSCSWEDIESAAGFQPMLIGGRSWCHWSGVRMAGTCYGLGDVGLALLANPAPGYLGVYQTFSTIDFETLGPFSAVWFPSA